MIEIYYLITFENTHQAISSEQALQNCGFPVRIIPVPTELTANCGLAIRFDENFFPSIYQVLNSINYASLYKVSKNGFKKDLTRIP